MDQEQAVPVADSDMEEVNEEANDSLLQVDFAKKRTNSKYSAGQIAKVIQYRIETGSTIAEVARKSGIKYSVAYNYVQQ
ncbi:hypothetical protein DFQ30_009827 [Apophysomyces sp. BC1015]|nr:hypothetical protein DFQ30_009827 [Apophysomyces sp. BC1015]